jgi:hypothetical protein
MTREGGGAIASATGSQRLLKGSGSQSMHQIINKKYYDEISFVLFGKQLRQT